MKRKEKLPQSGAAFLCSTLAKHMIVGVPGSSPGIIFCTFFEKLLTYCEQYAIIIDRKEVNALSKRKKKSGNQTDSLTSKINLIAAILNLITIVLVVIEKLTE